MLLDYVTNTDTGRPAPEGVRVAGLLDLANLLKMLGNEATSGTMSTIKKGIVADPEGMYRSEGLFVDPRGRVMKDTGPTYVGRELPKAGSLRDIAENGTSLADYLNGTEAGDVFAEPLKNVNVGTAPLPPGFFAGYTAPQGFVVPSTGKYRLLQPGFLVVNNSVAPEAVGRLFEHEMQHAYQGILDMPRGTSLDEMTNDMMDYLQETGSIRPAQRTRIDEAAVKQRASKPYMRYASSTGEAEARAAEARYHGMQQGYDVGMPRPEEYFWTHDGPTITKSMLFDIPQNAGEGFNAWWQKKWKK